MRTLFAYLAITLSVIFFSTAKLVHAKPLKVIEESLALIGIAVELRSSPTMTIEIKVNSSKAVEAVPVLQVAGILRPDINPAFIRTRPLVMTNIVATSALPEIIQSVYEEYSALRTAKFVVRFQYVDIYGNAKEDPIIQFDFDRDLYQKINWQNFSAVNLHKVAKNFRFTPQGQVLLGSE